LSTTKTFISKVASHNLSRRSSQHHRRDSLAERKKATPTKAKKKTAGATDEESGRMNLYGDNDVSWEDVLHFVVLPNYKVCVYARETLLIIIIMTSAIPLQEDIEILREALDTISVSTLAREQVLTPRWRCV
jgi:hypothetical protein